VCTVNLPADVPRFASEAERLEWCKAIGLGAALAVSAGCPGAQLRPEPGECPEEAVKAMKEHGLKDGDRVTYSFGDPEEGSPPLKQGRVEAVVVFHELEDYRPSNLPN
jgi:poly(3-hydroxybutyrate) depolymerase